MPAWLPSDEVARLFEAHVVPNYVRTPVSLVRGEGSWVWDAEGNRYLDLFPGWGCHLLGHGHPAVVEAATAQMRDLIHVPNTWLIERQARWAEMLAQRSFGGQAFFCNSGAEANEAAIKLARLHGGPDRYRIVTFTGGFHGRTMGAVSATAQPKYHDGIEPILPGFVYCPFGDLDAVREAVDETTCAILVEPVQGEGGVRLPPDGFLEGLRAIADENQLILIFDEVQTGCGRLGTWFGYQHWGVQPDIMTLAKGVAGGVACGAIVAKEEIAPSLRPGMHASTFGGNPLAMSAGVATVQTIEQENLLEHSTAMSQRFAQHFEPLLEELPIVRELRIAGMMIGIDLTVPATPIVSKCMERGVLLNATHDTVVRLLPALNITAEQVDEGAAILIEELRSLAQQN